MYDYLKITSALSGPTPASFKYDPLGRRTQKTLAGVTTRYLYDGANSVQDITPGSGATPTDTIWMDDALPTGATATTGNEGWSWITANPAPYSGTRAHISPLASGSHHHSFIGATASLPIATGDTLYAYVYLDPTNPPSEILMSWHDGVGFEHRAYWGANLILVGTNGTNSRRYMGALPATGQWVRLEVPASQVGLEGLTVKGMSFSLYNGKATWDKAGKTSAGTGATPQTVNYLTGLGIDERLSRTDSAGARYYLTDALGSTIALTDSAGALQTQYSYDPFGNTTVTGPTNPNAFQYTGRENDGTGLYYYRARYYSPTLQRFVSSDPIGLAGGLNTYTYVGNDPVNWVDPLGLYFLAPGAGEAVDLRTHNAMQCFERCIGPNIAIIVTGARESGYPHLPGSAHERGQACDLGKNSNPDLSRNEVERCFNECTGPDGFVWGYEGVPNFHLQTRPNVGGGGGFAPGTRRYAK